jgi:spore germination cell wall hydrolase CwlJ-like protein
MMPGFTLFRSTFTALLLVPFWLIPGVGFAVNFDNSKDFDFDATTKGQELGCLAMNIYHEGRGESARGRAAIASVTLNRVKSRQYPDTICKVVWQPKQFSWTKVNARHHIIRDAAAWQQALVVARLFIKGAQIAEVGDATHYHSVRVQPSWSDSSQMIARVGDHFFYAL